MSISSTKLLFWSAFNCPIYLISWRQNSQTSKCPILPRLPSQAWFNCKCLQTARAVYISVHDDESTYKNKNMFKITAVSKVISTIASGVAAIALGVVESWCRCKCWFLKSFEDWRPICVVSFRPGSTVPTILIWASAIITNACLSTTPRGPSTGTNAILLWDFMQTAAVGSLQLRPHASLLEAWTFYCDNV